MCLVGASKLAVYPDQVLADAAQPADKIFELASYGLTANVGADGEARISNNRVIESLRDVATIAVRNVEIELNSNSVTFFDTSSLELGMKVEGIGVQDDTEVVGIDPASDTVTFSKQFTEDGIRVLTFKKDNNEVAKAVIKIEKDQSSLTFDVFDLDLLLTVDANGDSEERNIEVSGDGVPPGTKVVSVLKDSRTVTFNQTFTQEGLVSLRFLEEDSESLKKIKVYGEGLDFNARLKQFNLATETIVIDFVDQAMQNAQLYFGLNRFVAFDPTVANSVAVGMQVEGELATIEAPVNGDNLAESGDTEIELSSSFSDGIQISTGFNVSINGSPVGSVVSYNPSYQCVDHFR